MPTEVSPTIMDTKAFVQQVLNKMEDTGDYERRAWDSFWRAVLEHILEGGQGPTGTVPEIILIVQRLLRSHQDRSRRAVQLCPAFHHTNRSTSIAFSELWCEAEYPGGDTHLFHTSSRGQQQHAETQALQRLQRHIHGTTRIPRKILLYMNVSPCRECADALIAYKVAHPETQMTIKFTSLFAHHASNHRRGLQRMAESNIQLAVFDDKDWDFLTSVICKDSAGSPSTSQDGSTKKSRSSEGNYTETEAPKKRQKV